MLVSEEARLAKGDVLDPLFVGALCRVGRGVKHGDVKGDHLTAHTRAPPQGKGAGTGAYLKNNVIRG